MVFALKGAQLKKFFFNSFTCLKNFIIFVLVLGYRE